MTTFGRWIADRSIICRFAVEYSGIHLSTQLKYSSTQRDPYDEIEGSILRLDTSRNGLPRIQYVYLFKNR